MSDTAQMFTEPLRLPCCGHEDAAHSIHTICEEVIHYPSEDYPCLCDTVETVTGDTCAECGHPPRRHVIARICTPAAGGVCLCREVFVEE